MTELSKWSKRSALTLKHISQCTESGTDEEQKQPLLSSKVWYTLAHMALHHCAVCARAWTDQQGGNYSQPTRGGSRGGCWTTVRLTAVLGRIFAMDPSHPTLCENYYYYRPTVTFRGVHCFNGISIRSFQDIIY